MVIDDLVMIISLANTIKYGNFSPKPGCTGLDARPMTNLT